MKKEIKARTSHRTRIKLYKDYPYLEEINNVAPFAHTLKKVGTTNGENIWVYDIPDSTIEKFREDEPWIFL